MRWCLASTYLAGERNEMMLAQAEDLNVLDDHHLVMALTEHSPVDDVFHVDLVSFREGKESLGVSGRGVEKTLTIRVLANTL